jgi:hypothetical protein
VHDQQELTGSFKTKTVMRNIVFILLLFFSFSCRDTQDRILIEAESFDEYGGWVNDAQFIDQMGSPYLMAHGLGRPVDDAVSSFTAIEPGTYHVYLRTVDWVAPFGATPAPGLYQVLIDGQAVGGIHGDRPAKWGWTEAGTTDLAPGEHEIRLHDLTGFNGRVDAIFLSREEFPHLPNEPHKLFILRLEGGAIPKKVTDRGEYDLVVVGGGIAGISAAVSAARLGLKTALIQNRPVLGGNNSSEVRVHLEGGVHQSLYPALGGVVRSLGEHHPPNAAAGDQFMDEFKMDLVRKETNLHLFLNTHMNYVDTRAGRITRVYAIDTRTGERSMFDGTLFADCTGDGTLGYLAGADYRYGREGRTQTGEPGAPEKPDSLTMGSSNLWRAVELETSSTFPETPWALQLSDEYFIDPHQATWRWESGFDRDIITEAEQIRDHNLRAVFGNWSYLKNNQQEKYSRFALEWVAFVAGKRESRRLLGDVILSEVDIMNQVEYDDAAVTLAWDIDLHYADTLNSRHFPGEEFISLYEHTPHEPYHMPYRSLYSRNIKNLFMAGRNASTTHIALGSSRVMKTGGMMGEVVGMAASICIQEGCEPRAVYTNHMEDLKQLMIQGI